MLSQLTYTKIFGCKFVSGDTRLRVLSEGLNILVVRTRRCKISLRSAYYNVFTVESLEPYIIMNRDYDLRLKDSYLLSGNYSCLLLVDACRGSSNYQYIIMNQQETQSQRGVGILKRVKH